MSPNRLKHQQVNAKARGIREELARLAARDGKPLAREVTIDDVCWMARAGEFLPPSATAIDDKLQSSWLYGPAVRTQQMERIDVVELDEHGKVIWRAETPEHRKNRQ